MFNYKEISDRITEIGEEKNPQRMAMYIYYLTKQYPLGPFVTDYDKNVKKTLRLVAECFSWSKTEIADLRKQLAELTKYIKK